LHTLVTFPAELARDWHPIKSRSYGRYDVQRRGGEWTHTGKFWSFYFHPLILRNCGEIWVLSPFCLAFFKMTHILMVANGYCEGFLGWIGSCRYIWTEVSPARVSRPLARHCHLTGKGVMVSGSGVCATTCSAAYPPSSPRSCSTTRRSWWPTARRSASPRAPSVSKSSDRVSNQMGARLSVTSPWSYG
jgi:hypothetical protein